MIGSVLLGENEVAESKAVISTDGILHNSHHIPAGYNNYNNRGKGRSKSLNHFNQATHLQMGKLEFVSFLPHSSTAHNVTG